MASGYYKKRLHNKDVRPRMLALNDRVLVYYDKCYLYTLRLCDGQCIGHVNVHAQISSIALCRDQRTVVVGCEDYDTLLQYHLNDIDLSPREQQPPSIAPTTWPLVTLWQEQMVAVAGNAATPSPGASPAPGTIKAWGSGGRSISFR